MIEQGTFKFNIEIVIINIAKLGNASGKVELR